MIGKSLNERFATHRFTSDRAKDLLDETMRTHAQEIVAVRARGPEMVAIVVLGSKKAKKENAATLVCRELGFQMKPGGTGVVGVAGTDVPGVIPSLSEARRAWLATPSAANETKVVLAEAGIAFLAIDVEDGKVTTRVFGDVIGED